MFRTMLSLMVFFFGLNLGSLRAQDDISRISTDTAEVLLNMLLAQEGDTVEPDMPGHFGQARHRFWDKTKNNPEFELQRKHVEQLRTLKMLEMLDLAEEQEIHFLTTYRNFRKELHRLRMNKMDILQKLSALIKNPETDDEALYPVIDEFLINEEAVRKSHDHFIESVKSTLSAEQLARFIIFEERFEAELLERVRSFRRQGEGRP